MPISIVALICVGFVIGAVLMQNSWWTDSDRAASPDQQASDGMSVFTGAGMDYLTREGRIRVRVGEGSRPASELGLQANGSRTFEPIIPIQAVVVAPDGLFHIDLIRSFTLTTRDNRVVSAQFVREANGSWLTVLSNLRRVATLWGWTDADLERLQSDLTAAARDGDGKQYSALLPAIQHNGALVSAEVSVDLAASEVSAAFIVTELAP